VKKQKRLLAQPQTAALKSPLWMTNGLSSTTPIKSPLKSPLRSPPSVREAAASPLPPVVGLYKLNAVDP
jgi:hypothetical protein